ncbi:MAG: hypothetical protein U1D30_13930 [Planctomycetota bacterium]
MLDLNGVADGTAIVSTVTSPSGTLSIDVGNAVRQFLAAGKLE